MQLVRRVPWCIAATYFGIEALLKQTGDLDEKTIGHANYYARKHNRMESGNSPNLKANIP